MLPMFSLFYACSTSEPEVAPAPAPAPVEAPAEDPAAAHGEAKPPGGDAGGTGEVHTLVSIEAGDAGCYVTLKAADGKEQNLHGSFDLCPGGPTDAAALVGKPVHAEIKKEEVMAGSCEGNPECQDREKVDFVVSLKGS